MGGDGSLKEAVGGGGDGGEPVGASGSQWEAVGVRPGWPCTLSRGDAPIESWGLEAISYRRV